MPEPLAGLAEIAEYASRFEADAAVSRLDLHGIEATALSDPAHRVHPLIVTSPGHRVVVAAELAAAAREVLAAGEQPRQVPVTGWANRPAWIKIATLLLIASVIVPVLISAVGLVL